MAEAWLSEEISLLRDNGREYVFPLMSSLSLKSLLNSLQTSHQWLVPCHQAGQLVAEEGVGGAVLGVDEGHRRPRTKAVLI